MTLVQFEMPDFLLRGIFGALKFSNFNAFPGLPDLPYMRRLQAQITWHPVQRGGHRGDEEGYEEVYEERQRQKTSMHWL